MAYKMSQDQFRLLTPKAVGSITINYGRGEIIPHDLKSSVFVEL